MKKLNTLFKIAITPVLFAFMLNANAQNSNSAHFSDKNHSFPDQYLIPASPDSVGPKGIMNHLNTINPTMKVYPNPGKDNLTITLTGNTFDKLNYKVFDLTGKSILSGYIQQITED
jgi:hypothetical protein